MKVGRTATGGMAQPIFFKQPPSSTLAELAALTGAVLVDPARGDQVIRGLASLDEAGPMHLAFFDNLRYADQLKATKAGACLVSPRFEAQVPAHVAVLRASQPFRAFVTLSREWHADALRPQSWFDNDGIAPSADHRPVRPSGGWRHRRSACGDRAQGRDRRRHRDRRGRGDRRRRQNRPRLQCRRPYRDPVRPDRQQRPDPSRLQHRPGRLWLHLLRPRGPY